MSNRWARRTDEQRKFPTAWRTRKWPATADIGRLPSAIGILSGPTRTMYGSRYVGSRDFDEAQRLERQRRVSSARSRKLAARSTGNPELASLDAGSRYPRDDELDRPLYVQRGLLFTPERRSIFAQGPFGVVRFVMSALGM